MLQHSFIELISKFTSNNQQIEKLWSELVFYYSEKGRYYHTLKHLENMVSLLSDVKGEMEDWDAVLFAVFYHDVVYRSISSKNEEKSAVFAQKRLHEIAFPEARIQHVVAMILATKRHLLSENKDTNLLTDADLAILGAKWDVYFNYTTQVRKEYSVYPDFMYKSGRRKAISHFLEMDRIFKTPIFFEKFERQARENLANELKML